MNNTTNRVVLAGIVLAMAMVFAPTASAAEGFGMTVQATDADNT
jgi:hypothetical protein